MVEVSQRAILVLRLFDWDRTSDDESLGRLGNRLHNNINEYPTEKQKHIQNNTLSTEPKQTTQFSQYSIPKQFFHFWLHFWPEVRLTLNKNFKL